MALDRNSLTPITGLNQYENPFGGDQGGLKAGTGGTAIDGSQTQRLRDAQGRNVLRIVRPNGVESFAVETGKNKAEIYDGSGNKIKDWEKRGALETVLGDEKFMTFLAIAAGGAAAGMYSGAGAGAGSGAAGMGGGSGLTMGSGGVTGLTAGGGGLGLTGAGASGAAGTGGLFSAGAGMGSGAAAAGTGGFMSQLFGGGSGGGSGDWAKLIGGLGSNVIGNQHQQQLNRAVQEANQQSIAASREAGQGIIGQAGVSGQHLTDVAGAARNRMLDASREAAQMAQFTPYNISGGLAGVQFGPNGATKTLDPRMKAIQDRNLQLSQGFLNSVNAGTPEELARRSYEGYNSWAAPQREQEVAGLQNRLAGQGLIGMRANTTSVNGNRIQINPQMTELLEGQERARLKNYENSILFGQQVTNNQLGMGNQQLGQAVGIDQLGTEAIKLGQSLGDSRAAAGARAGGFLTSGAQQAGAWDVGAATQAGQWQTGAAERAGHWYNNAAQNAAMNLSQRRQSEAGADAMRDQNIWNSIWGSVIGA